MNTEFLPLSPVLLWVVQPTLRAAGKFGPVVGTNKGLIITHQGDIRKVSYLQL